jgi:methyltransferase (TIGR00027 family)
MTVRRPSISAQQATLARAHLTQMGCLDDALAETMLRSPWREIAAVSRWPLVTRQASSRVLGYFAARTTFYDEAVRHALADGATQVVILGAGYDSRAWRLARPGVRFFEVDHPVTQSDKRYRAPAGGPMYIPVDLEIDNVVAALKASGFIDSETTVYVAEGLLMYLSEHRVRSLFRALSQSAISRSWLLTSFAADFADQRGIVRTSLRRGLLALQGEPLKFWLPPEHVVGFLAETGWTVVSRMTGPEVAQRYIRCSHLSSDNLNRDRIVFVIAASGQSD